MEVIGRGNDDRVDLVPFLFEHLAPIDVDLGVGKFLVGPVRAGLVHVAQRVDRLTRRRAPVDVPSGPSAGSDEGEVQLSVGGGALALTKPERMLREAGGSERGSEETPARGGVRNRVLHGVRFSSWTRPPRQQRNSAFQRRSLLGGSRPGTAARQSAIAAAGDSWQSPALYETILSRDPRRALAPPRRLPCPGEKGSPETRRHRYTDTPFLPGGKWRVHDDNRPRPEVVTPGENGRPRPVRRHCPLRRQEPRRMGHGEGQPARRLDRERRLHGSPPERPRRGRLQSRRNASSAISSSISSSRPRRKSRATPRAAATAGSFSSVATSSRSSTAMTTSPTPTARPPRSTATSRRW